MTTKFQAKRGNRQDDYLHTHGSQVIVLSGMDPKFETLKIVTDCSAPRSAGPFFTQARMIASAAVRESGTS